MSAAGKTKKYRVTTNAGSISVPWKNFNMIREARAHARKLLDKPISRRKCHTVFIDQMIPNGTKMPDAKFIEKYHLDIHEKIQVTKTLSRYDNAQNR